MNTPENYGITPAHPTRLRRILLPAGIGLLAIGLWQATGNRSPHTPPAVEPAPIELIAPAEIPDIDAVVERILTADPIPMPDDAMPRPAVHEHVVERGDTLSALFSQHELGHDALMAVLSADEELLALDTLRPRQRLQFEIATSPHHLSALTLWLDAARSIHYRLTDEGLFEAEERTRPTAWRQRVVAGRIQGSFYHAARDAGLNDGDIVRIQHILETRINFRRDIRADDRFEVILAREWVGQEATGRTRVEALRLHTARRTESAFLHDDGNYYDETGESLTRAFLRYPTEQRFRISSPFNLRRVHPVTGRVAPHHGVDFAMPIGTPVLSTGDGVVSRTGNHPFAGKYVEIDHHGQFSTRYLHLDRILVRRGQQVDRGERIARSGNTGRSTGPHLHYELHLNNRPVDPLTADLPTSTRLAEEDRERFLDRVATLQHAMARASLAHSTLPAGHPAAIN